MGSSAGLIGELMTGGRMGLNDAHLCGKDTLRKVNRADTPER